MQSGEVFVVKEYLALETDVNSAHISMKAVFRTLGVWITQSFGDGKNVICITNPKQLCFSTENWHGQSTRVLLGERPNRNYLKRSYMQLVSKS